ncbi:Ig-like domain-containing protein [uncultured Aquimarina sp.]|uniref:Ig-like domain-containing protein n=1 Tax=uncultured Aquimarina sp. TaxID=575652 RepID=UPI0026211A30|nr:Ig-like domain-containing protein [uncultured Aquimarina sp.]
MIKNLICIYLLLILGNQLLFSQADYISWEFKGGSLLNNPDGTSTGPGPEPAGLDIATTPNTSITRGRLRSAILGDLDNDGDLDFISGSQGGTVHYFKNEGTITSPNWVAASIPTLDTIWIDRDLTVRNQNRPQLTDIDDDGDLDLFIGTDYDYERDRNNDILFYRNIGTPEIPVFEYIPDGLPGLNDQEIAEFPGLGFVDLDNDSDLDMVALGSDKLTYYKNIGTINNPIFELQSETDSPWVDENAFNNMDVPIPVFEDFDKDGDYDMFFMTDTGFVRWIENIGTTTIPSFASTQNVFNGELTSGQIGSFATIDFGDVDGDGLKDAILGSFNTPRFAWFKQVPICISPIITEVTGTTELCEGESSIITISGNLNSASTWSIYTDSCGENLLGTTTTNISTFEVTPTIPSTTYYIRGEDSDLGCIDETIATCTTITIMVNTLDDPSFNYNQALYCTDASNPTPTVTGLANGTFSSTTGLILDPSLGTINITDSTPGEYTVTYTTNGTCPNTSDVTVTITELDDPNFSYDAALYCTDASNPTPTINGLAGGIFSSTTGLILDPSLGTINIADSTPGEYTVTYTTNGTCPNTSDVTVTITELDDPSFSYDQALYCTDASNPTPTINGLAGGAFSSTAGLVLDPSLGTINIADSTPGEYIVTYTTNGTCPNTRDVTVTITELDDPSFNYDQALYCKDAANPTPTINGLAGGVFSSTIGLDLDPSSGTINIADTTPGAYVITYTTNGTCQNTSTVNVTITELDDPSFSYDQALYCKDAANPTPTINGLAGGIFSSTTSLILDPSLGTINIADSTPGEYTVTYTTNGTCPNTSDVTVTITELDDPSFNYDAALYCTDASNPTPTVAGLANGTFSSTTGLVIDPALGTINIANSTPGEYTVTYTTNGTCPNTSNVTVTITELDDPNFSYDAALYCTDASNPTPTVTGLDGGTFSSTTGLVLDPALGTINIADSTLGEYTVTYTTNGTCPNTSGVTVTITELDDPNFSYDAALYCTDASNPTPTINGLAGGVFSSTIGLDLDPSSGTINIADTTPGAYVITYTTNGTCQNTSTVNVTITELDDPSFSYNQVLYCKDAANPTPTINGLAGGAFSSTAGLVLDPSLGTINIADSTPGEYIVTYTTNGTCPNTRDVTVTITELDDPSFNYDQALYCADTSNPTPTINGLMGGTFSSTTGLVLDPALGTINIADSTPGEYTVTYTTNGTCPNTSDVTVTITELDDPSFSYNQVLYCKDAANPTPTINGLAGGSFSSTAGLVLDPSLGTINIADSTPGEYIVTYTTNGTCPNTRDVTVTITELDDPSFNYDQALYCKDAANPTPTINGLAGGVFSSTTGLDLDPSSGTINIADTTPGAYVITYTTNGTCQNTSTVNVTITELDDPSFSYDQALYCKDAANPTPTINGLAGGVFSSTTGLDLDPALGTINIADTTPGAYVVTYTTNGTCSNSSTFNIIINALDNASFSYMATSYSTADSDPTPTVDGITGGTFTSMPTGLAINGSTGEIDISASILNMYTVTYTTSGICSNSSSVGVTIADITPPTVSITSTESNPTSNTSFEITISFSEDVTAFDLNDIIVENGVATNLSGGGLSYNATITAITSATITININADSLRDLYGNGNTAAAQFSIDFDNTLGIDDENLTNGISIYPIPSNNIINISGEINLSLKRVEFFDIQGKLILYKKLNRGSITNSIDISSIRSGLYLMMIYSERGSTTKKILKE